MRFKKSDKKKIVFIYLRDTLMFIYVIFRMFYLRKIKYTITFFYLEILGFIWQ